jgi:hypothetical protein
MIRWKAWSWDSEANVTANRADREWLDAHPDHAVIIFGCWRIGQRERHCWGVIKLTSERLEVRHGRCKDRAQAVACAKGTVEHLAGDDDAIAFRSDGRVRGAFGDFDAMRRAARLPTARWDHEDMIRPKLATLKAQMVAAHPDRGGSDEAFIEAHRLYRAAKGARPERPKWRHE